MSKQRGGADYLLKNKSGLASYKSNKVERGGHVNYKLNEGNQFIAYMSLNSCSGPDPPGRLDLNFSSYYKFFFLPIMRSSKLQIRFIKKKSLLKYQLGNPALSRLLKVTPAVYSHLNDFTGKLNFPYKSRPTQLRISKPS